MKRRSDWRFTLIEIVIALAILSISVTALLQLQIAAQNRMAQAVRKWREMHLLMQATEYYLLADEEEPGAVPIDFFDEKDYVAECRYEDVDDELPEEFNSLEGQLPLKGCVIQLRRAQTYELVDQLIVDVLDYSESSSL